MSWLRKVRNNALARWLFHSIFVTGDNVRLCVQKPVIGRLLPVRAGRALDAGAGSGEYTRGLLLPRAEQVVAMDMSAAGLQRLGSRLSRKQREKCQLVQGSIEVLPFAADSFDTVLCAEVLEHCQNDERAVAELARVLAPGGTLVVSVPVPPPAIEDPAHVRDGYTPDELCALLQRHGFMCQQRETCMFGLSRKALRLASWFHHHLKCPPPLMIMCYLERWLGSHAPGAALPFDVVIGAVREEKAE